jgi:hypothetical protein
VPLVLLLHQGQRSRASPGFVWEEEELRSEWLTLDEGCDHRGHPASQRYFQSSLHGHAIGVALTHSVTGSTKTSMVPPHARPTSQAISSVMP